MPSSRQLDVSSAIGYAIIDARRYSAEAGWRRWGNKGAGDIDRSCTPLRRVRAVLPLKLAVCLSRAAQRGDVA